MNQKQQTQQKQSQKAEIKTQESHAIQEYRCKKCGASYSGNDRFCSECGCSLNSATCPACGAETKPGTELCLQCGQNLLLEICSFCGNSVSSTDLFCSECGNPRSGITCPNCMTLNFRSFCQKCDAPLNEQARQALFLAKQDPMVKKTATLVEELAQLEEYILSQTQETKKGQLSEEDLNLVNEHKELLASIRGMELKKEKPQPNIKPQPKPENNSKISFSIHTLSKEEAMEKYKEKLKEMQETLSAMIPDAGMTPQMQRDFHSARKVEIEVLTRQKVPIGWRCKAYGCLHSQPNECVKPFSGGEWIYEEREILTRTWGHK